MEIEYNYFFGKRRENITVTQHKYDIVLLFLNVLIRTIIKPALTLYTGSSVKYTNQKKRLLIYFTCERRKREAGGIEARRERLKAIAVKIFQHQKG